ncbi:MAG: cysteine hydrolase [Bacillota bacterium]
MGKHYSEWEPVFRLVPGQSALLVIDMQKGFIEEGAPLEVPMAREQVPVIKELVAFCRRRAIPVLYTAFCLGPDFYYDFYWKMAKQRGLKVDRPDCDFWDGKREVEIVPELQPLPGERVIKKCGYDGFAGTELDIVLRSLGVKYLIITGTVLNWCVDSTVRGAFHRHYHVVVVADAVSTFDHAGGTAEDWCRMELNLFAEAFGRVMSAAEVMKELAGS